MRIDKLLNEQKLALSQIKYEQDEKKKLRRRIKSLAGATALTQSIAESVQRKVHSQISSVVSSCLSAVFDDPYRFQIAFVKKRGKTEAVLSFVRGELEVDPLDSAGGGVVDVAAFALRVACVLASTPQLRKLIVLDEPFRHLHHSLVPRVGSMLHTLSERFNIQFVLVTQLPGLAVGKVIDLTPVQTKRKSSEGVLVNRAVASRIARSVAARTRP